MPTRDATTAPSRIEPLPGLEQRARELRVEELQRRIEELEGLDESAFGRFTAWDWLICVLGAIVAPAVALWWFAG